jgi:putative transposase
MAKKTYRPEEIIRKLREAEVRLSQGESVAEVVRSLQVSQVTYYR